MIRSFDARCPQCGAPLEVTPQGAWCTARYTCNWKAQGEVWQGIVKWGELRARYPDLPTCPDHGLLAPMATYRGYYIIVSCGMVERGQRCQWTINYRTAPPPSGRPDSPGRNARKAPVLAALTYYPEGGTFSQVKALLPDLSRTAVFSCLHRCIKARYVKRAGPFDLVPEGKGYVYRLTRRGWAWVKWAIAAGYYDGDASPHPSQADLAEALGNETPYPGVGHPSAIVVEIGGNGHSGPGSGPGPTRERLSSPRQAQSRPDDPLEGLGQVL